MLKWFKFNKDVEKSALRLAKLANYMAEHNATLNDWIIDDKYKTDLGLPLLPENFSWVISPVFEVGMLDEPYRYIEIYGPKTEEAYTDQQLHVFTLYAEERYSTPQKIKKEAFMYIEELKHKAQTDLLTGQYPPKIFPQV